MVVGKGRCSQFRCFFAVFVALGFALCIACSEARAGGISFGFGVDVPLPGPSYGPPVAVPPPPVVVERMHPPAPVVIEQVTPPPPPVVVRRAPPTVVYEGPVVVEQRRTVYYYPQARQYRPQQVETEWEYYRQRNRSWED